MRDGAKMIKEEDDEEQQEEGTGSDGPRRDQDGS
jgi:hypothetical protein